MGQIAFILLSQSSSVCTYIVPVVVVHTAGGCIAVVQTVWSGYNRVVNKVVTVMEFLERTPLCEQEWNDILIQDI